MRFGEDSELLDLRAGSYVSLSVRDTGTGMDERTKTQAFEPFFTTKAVGRGTGLGLSTVHGIVRQSGGNLSVESELGRGTCFTIYLPASTEGAAPEARSEVDDTVGGTETILLVEDEPFVRQLTREILERRGYRVLEASNGQQAIAIVSEQLGGIDLVLTDIVMPRMRGSELAEKLAEMGSKARVLFMSAYAEDTFDQVVLKHGTPFINKPFTPAELERTVRIILDA